MNKLYFKSYINREGAILPACDLINAIDQVWTIDSRDHVVTTNVTEFTMCFEPVEFWFVQTVNGMTLVCSEDTEIFLNDNTSKKVKEICLHTDIAKTLFPSKEGDLIINAEVSDRKDRSYTIKTEAGTCLVNNFLIKAN